MMEIVKSDPRKFLGNVNGPALVAEEMRKRLKKDNKDLSEDEEELDDDFLSDLDD